MKDEQLLKDYFSHRLADCQSDSVPSFDTLFAGDALMVPKGHQLKLWPRVLAAVSTAAAVAAVAVYLFVLSPDNKDNPQVAAVGNALREDTFVTSPEPLTEELAPQPSLFEESETRQSVRKQQTLVVEDRQTEGFSAPDNRIGEPTQVPGSDQSAGEFSGQENETAPEVTEEIPSPQYERSIEEAHQAAQASRPYRSRRRARVGLSLARDNSLLASAPGQDYHSPMSSALGSYPSQGVSLRAASSRNEWRQPDNLLSSQIAEYAPVYHLPLSAGITVDIPLAGRWSLTTGLDYTYLSADITGSKEDGSAFALKQNLHYIGVPVSLSYRILDGDWALYASLGGGVEKGLAGVQTCQVTERSGNRSRDRVSQGVDGVQPYAGLSLGVSYRFDRLLQLYFEPGIAYYFDTGQPVSARTKNPLNASLSAGLRFCL